MFIRLMSDIHLEFGEMKITPCMEDKNTVLVLAGDVGVCTNLDQLGRFLVDTSVRFRAVIYVLGNHEFYHGQLFDTRAVIRQHIVNRLGLENVFLLENETKVIDDVSFIGATLWTNFDNSPTKAQLVSRALNDFRLIWNDRKTPFIVTPDDFVKLFDESKKYIFEQAKAEMKRGQTSVIVVHHGVSYQSVHPRFAGSPINAGFVSELTNDILDVQPDLIIHGHVHDAFDYMIGDTRIIANPRGYAGYEEGKNGFNPTLCVEI